MWRSILKFAQDCKKTMVKNLQNHSNFLEISEKSRPSIAQVQVV